ncbi:autoinducer 2 ABC transporter substrate-binding protein [Oceanobacillus sp. CFH 90083]|uniref:autoinducer 2 ABC transporter substrate-binding protein n=1 Tax=Oceanobacillus sp. CFH 90083 TaxID=2592336 RepID=UPI00128B642A|nr:autoinducer 2 ABC transporter substrate-binding protein [Oceanobacillus sp. CFH 90083]
MLIKDKNQKAILFVLISFLFFLMAACSDSSDNSDAAEDAEDIEVNEDQTTVAFIPQVVGIPYFTAMEEGGEKAAEELGAQFIFNGPTSTSAAEQAQIMDSLIRRNVDAISLSVLDSSSTNPMISQAKEAGLSVFTADSDSPDSERDIYVAQALDKDLGYELIDRLAAQIDNEGKIGIISGESTVTNLNTWIEYMEERLEAEYPDIEIVDIRYSQGGSSESALTEAQDLMTRHQDVDGLVAVSSTTIPGVAQAVQQAGKAGEVAVIGYGSPETVKPFIESGVMKESILWDAFDLGYLVVWAGVQLAEGNEFEEENDVPGLENPVRYIEEEGVLLLGPPLLINEDNVDDFDF